MRPFLLAAFAFFLSSAIAGPLPRDSAPEGLKSWIPWVLHGQEAAACPPDWNDAESRTCVWPALLEVVPEAGGAGFKLFAETFGQETTLALPGDAEHWPQEVMLSGKPLAVVEQEGVPVVRLPAGRHALSGRFFWRETPPSLPVPPALAMVRVKTASGWSERQADESGGIWLRAESPGENEGEALELRTFRRIEDGQPLEVLSRFELTFSGKPREVSIEEALLPDFVAVSLSSPLPARLMPDGSLRLQARPGVHVIEVQGRRMDRVLTLALPASAGREEIWSWLPMRALRVVEPNGNTVDPKQTGVPTEWQALPAYLLHPGDALSLVERRRGDPEPEPDKLNLHRTLWLDGDGGGFTVQDRIDGTLSRSWRLGAGAPLVLGHVSLDGEDQYITRLKAEGEAGFETRHGKANIVADSRIESGARRFSAVGWNATFQAMDAQLNLPPGWMLLHAGGFDRAGGSWISAWTLWDFFFLLLIALAAWKTCGVPAGLLLGLGLVLSWHMPQAPGSLWLLALGTIAAARALGKTRFAGFLTGVQTLLAALILLQLLVFGVSQARLALYPALEKDGGMFESVMLGGAPAIQDDEFSQQAVPAQAMQADEEAHLLKSPSPKGEAKMGKKYRQRYAQDAGMRVQTGPGLPQWRWHSYPLWLQGPVSAGQEIDLWLLPPAAHAVMRLLAVLLLSAAFWRIFGHGRRLPWPRNKALPATLGLLAILLAAPPEASAQSEKSAAPETEVTPPKPEGQDFQKWLDELRVKLLAPPDCMPNCAQLPRLSLSADARTLFLRLEAHAALPSAVPLPGQAQLRLRSVLLDGQAASTRRDESGQLWLFLPAGVHQVLMEADITEALAVNIALPLPPRRLGSHLTGWTLSGIDARGVPQGALTLSRASGGGKAGSATTRDSLPPLVAVERTFNLADRWSVDTRIWRLAPSLAPVQVVIPLLPGEQITDPSVRLSEGKAMLTLGAEGEARFASALDIAPQIVLKASGQANQVERWRLNADTRWHVTLEGLAPMLHQEEAFWLPQWQPWPDETVSINVRRPEGVPGPSLTLDSLNLQSSPGVRLTRVEATLVLRSSLGGSHTVQLPEGAELQSVNIDGAAQTLRAEGRKLVLPIHPGSQALGIVWHEPQGVTALQHTAGFDAGVAGVNATTRLSLGEDRWILAVGGPRLGPAILIWGTLVIILAAAFILARTRLTPLGVPGWVLLGLGVAQASIGGAFLIAAWFLLFAFRGRWGERAPRWLFNLEQILLIVATLIAIAVLFYALQIGLLGSPDMLVTGNGSHDRLLIWYQDRITGNAPSAWVLSAPMWAYRGLMLLWALWLAAGTLKWVRWAWNQAGVGGFWRSKGVNSES